MSVLSALYAVVGLVFAGCALVITRASANRLPFRVLLAVCVAAAWPVLLGGLFVAAITSQETEDDHG